MNKTQSNKWALKIECINTTPGIYYYSINAKLNKVIDNSKQDLLTFLREYRLSSRKSVKTIEIDPYESGKIYQLVYNIQGISIDYLLEDPRAYQKFMNYMTPKLLEAFIEL